MTGSRSRRRGQAWLMAVLAVYALLLAASPLLHHDVACHLKSPTHCTSCNASPWASRLELGSLPPALLLPDAGRVGAERSAATGTAERLEQSGRAPPA